MKKIKGQITVFLALTSLLILALICTTLEGARIAAVRYTAGLALRSAMDSVFAAFDGPSLDRYGLLLRRSGGFSDPWEDDAAEYAAKYLDPGQGAPTENADLIRLTGLSVEALDTVCVTEDNGAVFADAVLSYMKSAGIAVMLREVLERLGIYDEEGGIAFGETLSGFLKNKGLEPGSLLKDFDSIKEQAEKLKEQAEEADIPETEALPKTEEEKSAQTDSLLEYLDKWEAVREEGPIALVLGDRKMSALDWYDQPLPSGLPTRKKNAHAGTGSADFSIDEKFLLTEYVFRTMSCFTAPLPGGHQYEAEYLITGRLAEADALKETASTLLLIRTGLDLAYLLTDTDRQLEAEAAAEILMTALQLPLLAPAVKWILLVLWAAAEAVSDVKLLLDGKKVVLWKSKGSWRTDFLSLGTETAAPAAAGLNYEDHLRFLLYLTDGEVLSYRMMDVIQTRIRAEEGDFLLCRCMVEAKAEMTAEIGMVYLALPALRLGDAKRKGWIYKKTAAYGYGRR